MNKMKTIERIIICVIFGFCVGKMYSDHHKIGVLKELVELAQQMNRVILDVCYEYEDIVEKLRSKEEYNSLRLGDPYDNQYD